MNHAWRRILYRVGLVIGMMLFARQLWAGIQAIGEHSIHIVSPTMLVAACALVAMTIGLQILAWSSLMAGLGVRLPWHRIMWGYSVSFLPRYIPGNIWGYLSRSQWFSQNHNVSFAVTNGGSILEVLGITVSDGLWLGIYFSSHSGGSLQWAVLTTAILVPLVLGAILQRLPEWEHLAQRLPGYPRKWNVSLRLSLPMWLRVVGLYMILWLCYGAATFFLVGSLGFPNVGTLLEGTFVFGVAWLIGFLIVFVPAGLGVREVALAGLLASTTDMTVGQADVVSVLFRFVVSFGELFWIGLGLIVQNGRPKRP